MTKIQQPDMKMQEALDDLLSREPDIIEVSGKKYKVHWLHNGTVRKFSHVMVKEKSEWKRNVKVCACVLLNKRNGLWTFILLHVWYWIFWRWLYYVKDINQIEVVGVLNAAKKKIQSEPLALASILSIEMMDTMMTMAQHELGRAALTGAQPTH